MVLRDVNHDNYIRRPKERGKQVGNEGVRLENYDLWCKYAQVLLPVWVSYLGNSSNIEPAHCEVAIPQ